MDTARELAPFGALLQPWAVQHGCERLFVNRRARETVKKHLLCAGPQRSPNTSLVLLRLTASCWDIHRRCR